MSGDPDGSGHHGGEVRIVAATSRRLGEEVAAGRFRRDLYYRLNVVDIQLPSLRERRADIPYLTAFFVREFSKQFNKPLTEVSEGAERLLQHAPWAGNIRELRHTIERACMLSDGRILTERELLAALGEPTGTTSAMALPHTATAPEPDRHAIEEALQKEGGNISGAARRLSLSRRALSRRLDAFGLR